jgi:hypothetical protein
MAIGSTYPRTNILTILTHTARPPARTDAGDGKQIQGVNIYSGTDRYQNRNSVSTGKQRQKTINAAGNRDGEVINR